MSKLTFSIHPSHRARGIVESRDPNSGDFLVRDSNDHRVTVDLTVGGILTEDQAIALIGQEIEFDWSPYVVIAREIKIIEPSSSNITS